MGQPTKLLGGAHPAAVRNPCGPRADRWQHLYAFTETEGTTITDLGVKDALGSAMPLFGSEAWTSEVDDQALSDGSVYATSVVSGANHLLLLSNNSGAPKTFTRGTLMIRFAYATDVLSTTSVMLGTGQATGTYLTITKNYTGSDRELRIVLAGTTIKLTVPGFITAGGAPIWHTLLMEWGERGLTAWLLPDTGLDGVTPGTVITATNATTSVWTVENTKTLRVLGNSTPTVGVACGISCFGLSDGWLTTYERDEILADPHILLRPAPGVDFGFPAGPLEVLPTSAGVTFNFTTGLGTDGVLSTDTIGVRTVHGTSKYFPDEVTPPTSVALTTDTGISLRVQVPATTLQWCRHEYTIDGETWYPFPAGLYRIVPLGVGSALGKFSDGHTGARSPAGMTTGFGLHLRTGIANSDTEQLYALWQADRDYYNLLANDPAEPSFTIDYGDLLFTRTAASGKDDFNAEMFARACAAITQHFLRWKKGPAFLILGNHEGEAGYTQNALEGVDCACQKQCAVIRQIVFPGPAAGTYAEGGENEGAPTRTNSLDWLPAVDARDTGGMGPGVFDGDYRDEYVIDAGGRNGPRGNYYAFTWGNLLFMAVDPYTYAAPGDPAAAIGTGGNGERTAKDWWPGTAQEAWQANVLSRATAPHILVGGHAGIGSETIGGVIYNRGSGIAFGGTRNEAAFETLLRKCRTRAFLKGHDHRYCRVLKDTVNIISLPTCAPLLAVTGIEASYGTRESQGADLATWGDGLGTAAGIAKMLFIRGYTYASWTAETITFKVRQTSLERDFQTGAGNTLSGKERYLAPAAVAVASAMMTLSEVPTDIGWVLPAATHDPSTSWWTGAAAASVALATPPGYVADEDHASATVAVAGGTADQNVHVQHVPRWVDEFTLDKATPEPHAGADSAAAGVGVGVPGGDGFGADLLEDESMNLQVLPSLTGITDQDLAVTVPAGAVLLIHPVAVSCSIRSESGSASGFTVAADTTLVLGRASTAHKVFIRAATGTVIELALA